jgi:hypothetical protein
MPISRLDIKLEKLYVSRVAALWGPGKWYISTKIDGVDVGSQDKRHRAKTGESFDVGWQSKIDISGKGPDDSIKVELEVFEKSGVLGKKKLLGSVETTIKYPFMVAESDRRVNASEVNEKSYYAASISIYGRELASVDSPVNQEIFVSRQHNSNTTFSTIAKQQVTPHVEICPVIPTPPRANLPPFIPNAALSAPKETDWAKMVPIAANLKLNALVNPSLIPVLSPTDPEIEDKAARIAVTYYHPGNLDTSKFHWKIITGPISFYGTKTGTDVLVYGLAGAKSVDEMAELEVHWESDTGPLLAKFRAWVGDVKEVPYRVNIIRGSTASALPRTKPQHIPDQMKKANVHMWQSGLLFVPDHNQTCWDGATLGKQGNKVIPGVFEIATADNKTLLFDPNIAPLEQNLWNFRPNVLQIGYFKSFGGSGAGFFGFATDEPGSLDPEFTMDGSPSSSWRRKSGLPGDTPAEPVKMKTLNRTRPRAAGEDQKSSAAVLAAEQADLAAIAAAKPSKANTKQHAEKAAHYEAVAKKHWDNANADAIAKRTAANSDASDIGKKTAAKAAEEVAAECKVKFDKAQAAVTRANASYASIKGATDPDPTPATDADRIAVEPFCDQRTAQDASDVNYSSARVPALNDGDMEKLFALVQSDFAVPSHFDWGANIAHEAAHVLGLAHRGSGGNPRAQGNGFNGPSADGVNDPNGAGYPYDENVMGYTTAKCQDFDLIQTKVMRGHTLCVRVSEKPELKPIPASGLPVEDDIKLLQKYLKGVKSGLGHGPYDLGTFGPNGVDGDFGAKSKAALKQFQTDYGNLAVDGIYGPKSQGAFEHCLNG